MSGILKSDEPPFHSASKSLLTVLSFSHFSQHVYVSRSVLYTFILNALGLSYTQIGFAAGCAHTLGGFLQMFFSLVGRVIPKNFLLAISNFLMSASLFGVGLSETFLSFFSSQILGEVGGAAIHPVSVDLISEKCANEVSTHIGLFYGLGYIGNIVGPVVLSYFALSFGWRYALFTSAFVPILAGVLLLLLIRKERYSLKDVKRRQKSTVLHDLKSITREKKITAMITSQAFLAGGTGQGVIATFIPLFLSNSLNLEQLPASALYSIAMLCGVIGTIFFGKYANKLGYLKTTMFCTFITSLSTFILSFQGGYTPALILNLMMLSLTAFPITSLMQATISKYTTKNQRDLALGLYLTVGFGVSSIWSSFIGYLIDLWRSFTPAWLIMSSLGLIALFFQLLAYKCRN